MWDPQPLFTTVTPANSTEDVAQVETVPARQVSAWARRLTPGRPRRRQRRRLRRRRPPRSPSRPRTAPPPSASGSVSVGEAEAGRSAGLPPCVWVGGCAMCVHLAHTHTHTHMWRDFRRRLADHQSFVAQWRHLRRCRPTTCRVESSGLQVAPPYAMRSEPCVRVCVCVSSASCLCSVMLWTSSVK